MRHHPFKLILILIMLAYSSTVPGSSASNTVSIALLPIIDSLPYYIAETAGDFKKARVDVKLVPVMSGLNRDQLMQAGEVDGMLNEIASAANFNRSNIQVQVLYIIRSAQPDYPMFRLIAAPKSGIRNVSGLKDASIGISRHTIIEYVTDRLLEANGLNPSQAVKKSVPPIPERYQLLMQGQLQSATLPDPLASAAIAAGAGLIIDDAAHPQFSVSLFTFSINAIQHKPETLKRFFRAWDSAVARLNANPEDYRELMLKKIRVPRNVQKSYAIPRFSRNSVPSRQQWEDVMTWMVSKGLLKKSLPYSQSVNTAFLPGN